MYYIPLNKICKELDKNGSINCEHPALQYMFILYWNIESAKTMVDVIPPFINLIGSHFKGKEFVMCFFCFLLCCGACVVCQSLTVTDNTLTSSI